MKTIKSNKDGEQSSLDCESINLIKIKENKSIHFLSKKGKTYGIILLYVLLFLG